MVLGEGIAFGGLILGFLTFVFKTVGDEENKKERILKRMDEIKLNMKEDYVTKEVCYIMHQQISSDLSELKKDVKTLLSKISAEKDN